ncbi:MAG TPA: prolyl oligopeptidase family serine peptidase, partial [Bryobacteraceae bacterium]|nr:prolyl oligopeptidase family serine peptidase [Bryobacteraceae bacterium]
HAAEYGVDPNRLAVIGDSAGAQLAMMAVLRAGRATPVAGVAAIAMPSDLVTLARESPSIPAGIRGVAANGPWADMLGAAIRELSPIHQVHRQMPPTLLIHGTADRVVPFAQSERFCEAARRAGAHCEVLAVRGEGHGFRWWSDAQWMRAMIAWLEARVEQTGVAAAS